VNVDGRDGAKLTLSGAELCEITGYKRPADQLRALLNLGFFRARQSPTTGRIVLERAHYDAVTSGRAANDGPARPRPKVRVPA
jgi:uncharacterized protein DUF4224